MTGIDLGSRFIKIASKKNKDSELILSIIDTIEFFNQFDTNAKKLSPDSTIATGYGRHTIEIPGVKVIPEIQAHAIGALHVTGKKDFVLLDIGGQDCKVIKVDQGKIVNFLTNDKCAASSGRYLENMARILDMSLEEIYACYEYPMNLSSTCAIFAESEVIGLIVKKIEKKRIAASINQSLFARIRPWLKECYSKTIILSGGVANSTAISHFINKDFPESDIIIPENAQFLGAIGCLESL